MVRGRAPEGAGGRRPRGDVGSVAVEFALVVPVLLLLVAGIVSYGYMLSFRQALSQATAEGARAAAVAAAGADRESLATAAVDRALSSYEDVTCAGEAVACEVSVDPCGADGPAYATVDVRYDYDGHPLTPELPGLGLVMPDTLSYRSSVRVTC